MTNIKTGMQPGRSCLHTVKLIAKFTLLAKRMDVAHQMTREEAEQVIADGQPWSEPGHGSKVSDRDILAGLSSWSPIVRERMATQLKNRKGNPIPQLVKMLRSDSLDAQRGALQAMSKQRGKLAPAVPELRRLLSDDDMWVRVLAAKALVVAGPPGRVALPQLLKNVNAE